MKRLFIVLFILFLISGSIYSAPTGNQREMRDSYTFIGGATFTTSIITSLADTNHYNVKLEENSGGEYWQVGTDASGNLVFYDEINNKFIFYENGDFESTVGFIGTVDGYTVMGHIDNAKTSYRWALGQNSAGTTIFNVPAGRWFYMTRDGTSFFRVSSTNLIEFDPNGGAAATFFVDSNADEVGLLTETPSTILDVVAGSATDPIADAWDLHCLSFYSSDIESVTPDTVVAAYNHLNSLNMYLARKTVPVKPLLIDFKDDILNGPEKPQKAQEKYEEAISDWNKKVNSKKYQMKHLKPMADDPNVPEEYKVYDTDGNLLGINPMVIIWDQKLVLDDIINRLEILEKAK